MNVTSSRDRVPTTERSNCYSNTKDASATITNDFDVAKEATTMERFQSLVIHHPFLSIPFESSIAFTWQQGMYQVFMLYDDLCSALAMYAVH